MCLSYVTTDPTKYFGPAFDSVLTTLERPFFTIFVSKTEAKNQGHSDQEAITMCTLRKSMVKDSYVK